jgi:general secretion pathway protein N
VSNNKLIITTAILFIFFIIATIPAKLAYSLTPSVKGLEVSLIEGSIWSGSAANVQYNGVDFGSTHWELSPLSLFLLTISGDIHSSNDDSQIDANFSISSGDLESDSIKASFPASWVPLLTGANYHSEGKVLLRVIDFKKSSDAPIVLVGSVAWQQAAIKTPFGSKANLGNLQIDISSENKNVLLDLRDNQGPLGIEAKIKFTPPNKIVARGSVNENLPIELSNFFRFFAKPNNKGKLVFDYNGILPGI